MSQPQPQHYAFVASSEPLEFPVAEEDSVGAAATTPNTAPQLSSSSTAACQESLVSLYQSYAERFPNPNLIQEYQERDQLLQATSAAHTARSSVSQQQQQQQAKKRKGFFGFLFGGSNDDKTSPSPTAAELSKANDDDDECLVYTEQEDDPEMEDDFTLCGTNHSLDRSCIPQDAHSFARFSLASQRTRQERPHVVRDSPHLPADSTICIVGLGMIAEWSSSSSSATTAAQEDGSTDAINNKNLQLNSHWTVTSDREDLLRFADKRGFDASLVRATTFGPNFIVVSWGFNDGIVVFYRRVFLPNSNIAWEAIVFLGPSQPVLEHSMDVFAEDDDDDRNAGGSDLLRVTDMVPMVVTTPGMPAASLAVSRLGGYMEVLPLPADLWLGPVFDASRHKPRPNKRKRGLSHPHYAKNHLVNIASDQAPIPILALTTMEYHLDILCLEAVRTRVTMDTEWDRELYDKAPPPAEYILVASGTQNGHEVLTFWAITYVFAVDEPPTNGSAGFTLHAVLQEALDVGTMGADQSIFANRAIMDQWRQPRKVSLKERPPPPPLPPVDEDGTPLFKMVDDADDDADENNTGGLVNDKDAAPLSVYDRVTTITTAAPIVAMHAIVVPVSTEEGDTNFVSMLLLQDWNGSVTIMDCSRLERMVSHSLREDEYAQLHAADMAGEGTEPPPPIILVETLVNRSRMIKWMQDDANLGSMQSCVSAQWLARTDNHSDPWLVLLSSSPGTKGSSRITIISGLLELDELDPVAVIETIPFPTSHASLQGSVSVLNAHSPSSLLKIIFPPKQEAGKLCVCLLQPLQPQDILLSLAREQKYEKAIQAAGQLSSDEQQHSNILEECRQKLWEQTFDLRWLKQVTDSAYIIQQAFLLFDENNTSNGEEGGEEHKFRDGLVGGGSINDLADNMDLDNCRDICMLALQCTSKIRLASALALGQGGEDAKEKLEGIIVRLGTFQLLCQALNAGASFFKFRNLFLHVSIVDLAMSFAPAGDIAALSILWFRHKRELQPHQLEILSQLPMTLKPHKYCYLLPVLSPSSDRIDSFIAHIPPSEGNAFLHISQLPRFLEEMDIQVVLNNNNNNHNDEKMVLGLNKASSCSSAGLSIEIQDDEVSAFFSSRATAMQLFVADLQDVADFCAIGLLAMGNTTVTLELVTISALSAENNAATHTLFCTRGCALALKRMLEESIGDSPLEVGEDGLIDLSPFASVTPLDLLSMDLVDVVKMVLGGQDDTETMLEIHRQHLLPLMNYLPNHKIDQLDQAIHDFCVQLVQASTLPQNGGGNEGNAHSTGTNSTTNANLLMALRTCAAIAAGSRTTIRKTDRIISDKSTLLSLVLSTANELSKGCHNQRFQKVVSLTILKLMWGMYESLPQSKSSDNKNDSTEYSELMSKANCLYQDLTGLEIISQWPGIPIFSFMTQQIQCRNDRLDEDDNERFNEVGQKALANMCRSFCSQAKTQKGAVGLSSLLRDLISDIEHFYHVCYNDKNSFLPTLVSTLSLELIAPLSRQAEFDLVAQFLTRVDKSWWDHEQEGRIIGSYVDAIVFAEVNSNAPPIGDHSLQAAIACQDALGPLFTDLQGGFQLSRQYLDAAHFINTVIFVEMSMPKQIHPNDLQGDLPLDVVESILRALPTAIVIGCKEWAKELLAVQANKALRAIQESPAGEKATQKNLPPIPGGAVFHLAGILGLDHAAPVLVVKSRVVHYGVVSGLFGASAAVCRTILHDQNAFSSDTEAIARMTAVAEIVTQEKYDDLATKRELCVLALRKFQTLTSIHDCKPFLAILEAFTALEARTGLAQQKERPQILNIPPPVDPITALYKDTWSQYSVNVYDLFSTLQQHATSAVVDDSLLNALLRYVFFSVIFRCTRLRQQPQSKQEKATTNELLVIGAALLLHVQDTTGFAMPAAKELSKILENQTLAVVSQHPSAFHNPFVKPNENIVRQLIGRGFTQMSARRSALATQNAGLQQAMQWGVTNVRDPRLNDPIIIVNSPQRMFAEKPSIQHAMHIFKVSQQFLSGSKTLAEWRAEHSLASGIDRNMTLKAGLPRAAPSPSPKAIIQSAAVAPAPAPAPALAPKQVEQKIAVAPAPAKTATLASLPKTLISRPAPKVTPDSTMMQPKTTATSALKVFAVVTSKPPAPAPPSPMPPPRAPNATTAQTVPLIPAPNAAKSAPQPSPPSSVALQPQPQKAPLTHLPRAQPSPNIAPLTQVDPLKRMTLVPLSKVPRKAHMPSQSTVASSNNLTINTKSIAATAKTILATQAKRSPSLNEADRNTLKQKGLDAMRSTPRSHEKNMDDRRRLIEAGRRLLAKSRSEHPAPPPKASPKPPSKASYTPYQPISNTAETKAHGSIMSCTAAPPSPPPPRSPANESYFFGSNTGTAKLQTPTNGQLPIVKMTKLAVDDDAAWSFNDESENNMYARNKTPPTPPAPKLSTNFAVQGTVRATDTGQPTTIKAPLPTKPFSAQPLSPAPPPQRASVPVVDPEPSESRGEWDDDLDELGDIGESAEGGDGWGFDAPDEPHTPQAPSPPSMHPTPPLPQPVQPTAEDPEISKSQGGWDDDLDNLGDLDESGAGSVLVPEPIQPVGFDVEATAPAANSNENEIDDGWGDDFDDF